MGLSYHQFCPVSKAMELLDERWTLLVVRELGCGSRRFNELRRGLPRISPALLSKRLGQLTRAGVVERRVAGAETHYVLTPAGQELRPVVEALGAWGVRWIGELGEEDLDPQLLLWDMHRNVDLAAIPPDRTVVRFDFPDLAPRARHWWLVMTPEDVDICDVDPGHEVAVTVSGSLRTLTEVWRGDRSWSDAIAAGTLVLHGSERSRRALPSWFTLSVFAAVPRPGPPATTPGPEGDDPAHR